MTQNQAIITAWLARDDTKLVLGKLRLVSDALQTKYDTVDFANNPGNAMSIQITRDVINNTIPRIIEGFMNEDKPEPRWSFRAWLKAAIGGKAS